MRGRAQEAPRGPWETEGNQGGSKEALGGVQGARGRPRRPKGRPKGELGRQGAGPGSHAHLWHGTCGAKLVPGGKGVTTKKKKKGDS